MPLAIEVKLAHTQRPNFPDKCVICGESNPDKTVQFKVDSLSWSSSYAASQPGAISVIDVPVKSSFKGTLRRQRKMRFALYFVYGIVGATIAMNAGDWLGRDLSHLQTILAVIVGLSPMGTLQIFLPPAFAQRRTRSANGFCHSFETVLEPMFQP